MFQKVIAVATACMSFPALRCRLACLSSDVTFLFQLLVVKQGDACEEELQRLLVEDKSPNGGASYADYLYHLHFNSVRLLQ